MKIMKPNLPLIQSSSSCSNGLLLNHQLIIPFKRKQQNPLFKSQNLLNKSTIKIPSFLSKKQRVFYSPKSANSQLAKDGYFKVNSAKTSDSPNNPCSIQSGSHQQKPPGNKCDSIHTNQFFYNQIVSIRYSNEVKSQKTSQRMLRVTSKGQQRINQKSQNKNTGYIPKKLFKVPSFIQRLSGSKVGALAIQKTQKLEQKQASLKMFSDLSGLSQNQKQSKQYDFGFKINIVQEKRKVTIDDFLLIKMLGCGSFGKAYLAVQKSMDFVCVIKMLKKDEMNDYEKNSLIRQIKIQSYLNHQHLTKIYGVFDDEEYIYLILQPLTSGNLKDQYKKLTLEEKTISKYVYEVSQGIQVMHENDILHRDIKCENIFSFENYVKIGDFGCSVYSDVKRKSFVGSPLYLSPQQLRNQEYDQKVDIWQIGVLTFELLFGRPPFQKDIKRMVSGAKKDPQLSALIFPETRSISEEAKDFIRKLLQKDCSKRLSLQQAMAHPFLEEARLQK